MSNSDIDDGNQFRAIHHGMPAPGSNYLLSKGHLYKTHLGASLSDLSSRLQQQRDRMPHQYEKFSSPVATTAAVSSARHQGRLPALTPRPPVIVESTLPTGHLHGNSRAGVMVTGETVPVAQPVEQPSFEIHIDVVDEAFMRHARLGAKAPWKLDCSCPRCFHLREHWVAQNRKPFRPLSLQREASVLQGSGVPTVSHNNSLTHRDRTAFIVLD